MRQITSNVTNAFANSRPFRSANSEVRVNGTHVEMLLHGYVIAEKLNGHLFISNCGYRTNVTKERLNGIAGVSIRQKNFVWYLNGAEWDGKRIRIN